MSSASNNTEFVDQFASITGTTNERAKFYLECANWQLDVALSQFYESDEPPTDDVVIEDEIPPVTEAKNKEGSKPLPAPNKMPKFATLSSLSNKPDSSSDDEGQAFYAGGSERSGQQILGPPKSKDGSKIVENVFQSAKQHGAVAIDPSDTTSVFKSKPRFTGTGYKLGHTSHDPSEAVPGIARPAQSKEVKLKLWKNGFSVDDGSLRDYNDPNNQTFLNSVSQGEIPYELLKDSKSGEVHVNMEDHRESNFQPVAQAIKPFTGEGHMLGSPTPEFLSSSTTPEKSKETIKAASESINVDSSKPVTNIQLRLADGSRLMGQFNHSHTVADIRRFIVLARPEYGCTVFTLQTTFPNKELTDDSHTLEDANLLNTTVHQKLQ